MCGRFYLDAREDALKAALSLSALPALTPRYNIAPAQAILGVVAGEEGRVGRGFRWGLIPSWAKDAKFGTRTINARVETLADKPAVL
ncbi:MAG: SOS response-associated peptidase [Candidatus Thiodiazotropha sp. (ex Monitilora ramsayi)]|nr:SOS response-associated peptidase [Candidatus Thiodiazotropha sp. (ex Monitilora ramsayi)]